MRASVLPAAVLLSASLALADPAPVQLREGPGKDLVLASCATCHSLDYVTMNSPFLDRKGWEASVNKMIKVMGATVAPEDAARIVDYLVAQYGPGAPAAAPAARVAAPSASHASPPAPSPEVLAQGQAAFEKYCVACHGPAGAGDGPAAASLKPPPKDLTGFSGGAPGVFAVLETGVKGTAMIDFQHLSEADRWAIAHYVISLKGARKAR